MSSARSVPTDGGGGLGHNPFGALSSSGLPSLPQGAARAAPQTLGKQTEAQSIRKIPSLNRGRVDIVRETGGRGGKTVTVVSGFVGIGEPEKDRLAKRMRAACGCGGTVKEGRIEIQGDQREKIAEILAEAGFRPVFAGG
jgi:translation initiation factor 1